jgi:maleylacetate reductase
VIVRWGQEELPAVLREVGIARPLLVTSRRWRDLDVPAASRFYGVEPHTPEQTVWAAIEAANAADGVLAVGGGSAIDTGKAVSARLELPVVSVPTTYSGAEWSPFFGIRDEVRRVKGGGGGAQLAGIVYEPKLTLGLPRAESGGTAMNALAHAAEALYVAGRNPEGDREALAGAQLISEWLPRVLEDGRDLEARTGLLEGAMRAGHALGLAGLGLGHAMAQALGGRYGLPHGAMNAICLPPALRFNAEAAADDLRRLGEAMGADDPIARTEELARLGGYERLRDFDVPEAELDEVADAAAVRAGAQANPRPATSAQIAELYRSVW